MLRVYDVARPTSSYALLKQCVLENWKLYVGPTETINKILAELSKLSSQIYFLENNALWISFYINVRHNIVAILKRMCICLSKLSFFFCLLSTRLHRLTLLNVSQDLFSRQNISSEEIPKSLLWKNTLKSLTIPSIYVSAMLILRMKYFEYITTLPITYLH